MVEIEFTRKIFGETLAEYGAVDSSIVVLTADVSSSVLTNYFNERFPERSFNTGIWFSEFSPRPCTTSTHLNPSLWL